MPPPVVGHAWSEEALFAKAKFYVQSMESHTFNDWQHGFWSALGLECLLRAALAHISPVLLADNRNWRNLAHALGKGPTVKKFTPRSLSTGEVISRLAELCPAFNEEIRGFCAEHSERRNVELHSGEVVFAHLGTSVWLPKFYLTCQEILQLMGRQMEDLFSKAEEAEQMVAAHNDAAANAVKQDIKAHKQVWSNKNDAERGAASLQAETWAMRHSGHRVVCPSCDSQALLQGSANGAVRTTVVGDEVVQKQSQLPSSFECIACGLRITGFSKLSACGLGNAFTRTSTYTVAEYFNLYTEDDLEEARYQTPEYEEDFNE